MGKRVISLLLTVVLLLTFGMSSALAVPTNQTNHSGKISLKGKVKIYSVTYHTNGGGGNAPVDANRYNSGEQAAVLGQGDMTAPSGKTFAGWASIPSASTATYLPGTKVSVGNNVDFYAVWSTATAVTATYHYKDKDGKDKDPKTKTYVKDETILMPTLTELGWEEGTGFSGWFTKSDYSGEKILPGAEKIIEADTHFYGQANPSEKIEFAATITWDDADNVEGLRPYPADVINEIQLSPDPTEGSYISAINTSGNVWTIVWSNLEKNDYSVKLDVENYTKVIESKNALTFRRAVGFVTLTMWISNKKWDKKGELIKFKPGQDVKFRMDVTNHGNQPATHIVVYDNLKGAKIKKADGYKVSDGYAYIPYLGPKETVSVFAVYRVTSSDQRKEKVVNVAGLDYKRPDGSWGTDWDAVRIPINRKSSNVTPRPTATPTPIPVSDYMVEKLLKDVATIMLAYPASKIEVVGAEEIMTADELAVYNTLNTQDKILTVLNSIGFNMLIPAERLRLNLTVSQQALDLMSTIYARKQVMTAEQRTAQQAKEAIYFPRQDELRML